MKAITLLAILLTITIPALAAPSAYQNDAGTGGDGGTWKTNPAPLTNRQGGVGGVYMAELYRYADEVDYFSMKLSGITRVNLSYTAEAHGPCVGVSDTQFVAALYAPDGSLAVTQRIDPCYGAGSIAVDSPASGKWVLMFGLAHPEDETVDVGTGPIPTAPATSTVIHERYVFGVTCAPGC